MVKSQINHHMIYLERLAINIPQVTVAVKMVVIIMLNGDITPRLEVGVITKNFLFAISMSKGFL